jgi:type IX secretion system PorP/SprF family membrane protein
MQKNKNIQRIVSVVAACIFTLQCFAQEIHFSQIFETPLLRNPALAGIFNGDIRVQSVYRSQWNSVTDAYKTVSSNMEYKLPIGMGDDFITLGGQVLYDKAGTVDLSATHILPAINYHKSLSAERNRYLSLAFMGGWVQRRIDRNKITTNNQFNGTSYNPTLSTGETFIKANYSYWDATVGMSYNSQLGENEDNNIYLGVAYHHFTRSKKISFYSNVNTEMKPKWVGSAGVRVSATEQSYVTFEGDYTHQGGAAELIAGFLYTRKLDDIEQPKYLIHAGAYARAKDAIIPVVKLENRPLSIAVSYDINTSAYRKASIGRGGFELSIAYQKFLDRKATSSIDKTRCPKF